jgi:nucleolar protein 4
MMFFPICKRGFAFVGFLFRSDAARAVKTLNEATIDTRTVAVDWALHQTSFEALQMKAKVEEVKVAAAAVAANPTAKPKPAAASKPEESSSSSSSSDDDSSSDDGSNSDGEDEAAAAAAEAAFKAGVEEKASSSSSSSSHGKKVDSGVEDERTLFVSNIPFTATQAALRSTFAQFGDIEYVAMVKDRVTGRPRGTAFVSFVKAKCAAAGE